MKKILKLLKEFEDRNGSYVINVDTADREFINFDSPKAINQLVVSSVCNHVKMAIKNEQLTYGDFKNKFPRINAFLERARQMGYRTFS